MPLVKAGVQPWTVFETEADRLAYTLTAGDVGAFAEQRKAGTEPAGFWEVIAGPEWHYLGAAAPAGTDATSVHGPAGATDEAIARYDGTTGELLQDSKATVTDTGAVRPANAANPPVTQTAVGLRAGGTAPVDAAGADGELYFRSDPSLYQRISAAWVRLLSALADSTALGRWALVAVTTGIQNTAIGASAATALTEAVNVVAVGYRALRQLTTGGYNTMVGSEAGDAQTTGAGNTGLGALAMKGNVGGANNTAVGYSAMETGAAGSRNTAAGFEALKKVTDNDNVAVGASALKELLGGFDNTAVGKGALSAATTPNSNTALGKDAGSTITTGTGNIMLGKNAQPSAAGANDELNVGDLIKGNLAGTKRVQTFGPVFPPNAANPSVGQTACGLYAGSGAPDNATGQDGDFYFRSDRDRSREHGDLPQAGGRLGCGGDVVMTGIVLELG